MNGFPSLDDMEMIARKQFAQMPEEFRALAGDVVFLVEDVPQPDVMRDLGLTSPFDLLGLFHGPDLAAQQAGHVHGVQTMIFLYAKPILAYCAETGEPLDEVVRHVLVHEIGHHFGLSDDDMEGIEDSD
jgi:predicted Zn-dependent protease with MMP-like domain